METHISSLVRTVTDEEFAQGHSCGLPSNISEAQPLKIDCSKSLGDQDRPQSLEVLTNLWLLINTWRPVSCCSSWWYIVNKGGQARHKVALLNLSHIHIELLHSSEGEPLNTTYFLAKTPTASGQQCTTLSILSTYTLVGLICYAQLVLGYSLK